jgi:hypothetical protein
VIVLALCVIISIVIISMPCDEVTKANFDRIPPNATRSDVTNLMGDPEKPRLRKRRLYLLPLMPELPRGCKRIIWRGYDSHAIFHFDENDVIIARAWSGCEEDLTILDKLHCLFDKWL